MRTLLLMLIPFAIISFQNCSGANFTTDSSLLRKSSTNQGQGEIGVIGVIGEGGNGSGSGSGNIPAKSPSDREACTSDGVQRIFAGQHYHVGNLLIARDGQQLSLTIQLKDGVAMSEVHINVGQTISTTQGPPGQFAYKSENVGNLSTYTQVINLDDHGISSSDPLFIAVHAVVAPSAGHVGEVINGRETAWAEGGRAGGGWQMVFQYAPGKCEPLLEPL